MTVARTRTPAQQSPAPALADRRSLALAVAAPGADALALDRDNAAAGWWSVPDAVAAGEPYAVEVRAGLLCLDLDTPTGEAADRYREVRQAVARHGVPTVEVASGRPGHRHLWLVLGTAPEALADRLAAACRPLDARRGGARVRPPLTPHREGHPVALLDPESPADALAVLWGAGPPVAAVEALVDALTAAEPTTDAAPPRRSALRARPTPLSPDMQALVNNGDTEARYASRSEALAAGACALVRAGHSDSAVIDLLDASPLSRRAADRRDPRGYLAGEVRRARETVEASPPRERPEHVETVERLREAAATIAWPRGGGVAPATVAAVLDALLRLSQRAGRWTLDVSVRQAAEAAAVGRGPAERALHALVAAGVLRRHPHRDRRARARYTLDRRVLSRLCGGQRDSTPRPVADGVAPTVPLPAALEGHDAWRRGALGPSARRVLTALDPEDAASTATVARAVGLSRRWTRELLGRLASWGCAVPSGEGWCRAHPEALADALDHAADAYDTAGAGDRQRARHEREREAFRLRFGDLDAADAEPIDPEPEPVDREPADPLPLPSTAADPAGARPVHTVNREHATQGAHAA